MAWRQKRIVNKKFTRVKNFLQTEKVSKKKINAILPNIFFCFVLFLLFFSFKIIKVFSNWIVFFVSLFFVANHNINRNCQFATIASSCANHSNTDLWRVSIYHKINNQLPFHPVCAKILTTKICTKLIEKVMMYVHNQILAVASEIKFAAFWQSISWQLWPSCFQKLIRLLMTSILRSQFRTEWVLDDSAEQSNSISMLNTKNIELLWHLK